MISGIPRSFEKRILWKGEDPKISTCSKGMIREQRGIIWA